MGVEEEVRRVRDARSSITARPKTKRRTEHRRTFPEFANAAGCLNKKPRADSIQYEFWGFPPHIKPQELIPHCKQTTSRMTAHCTAVLYELYRHMTI